MQEDYSEGGQWKVNAVINSTSAVTLINHKTSLTGVLIGIGALSRDQSRMRGRGGGVTIKITRVVKLLIEI